MGVGISKFPDYMGKRRGARYTRNFTAYVEQITDEHLRSVQQKLDLIAYDYYHFIS